MRARPNNPSTSAPRAQNGFSLLEAMGVVCLLGLLATIAAPSLVEGMRHRALVRDTRALRLLLEEGYAHTLGHQEQLSIHLSPRGAELRALSGHALKRHDLSRDVTLDLSPKTELILQSYPSISFTPQTLTLRSFDTTCDIVISLRGRIRTTC